MCLLLCEPAPDRYELRAGGVLCAHERAGAAAERPQSVLGGPDQWLHRHCQHGGSPHGPLDALLTNHQALGR